MTTSLVMTRAENIAECRPLQDDVVLDQKALDNLRAIQRPGTASILKRIIEIYLDQAPRLIAELHAATEETPDANRMRHAAHSLKSSSANLGATSLSSLCRDLEAMGRNGSTECASELIDAIDQVYPLIRELLQAELEQIAA